MMHNKYQNSYRKSKKRKTNYFKVVFSTTVFLALTLFIPGKSVISKEYNKTFGASDSTRAIIEPPSKLYVMDLMPGLVENDHLLKAGLLYDMESKKVLWEKEMNTAFPIASLTKMMVALLTIEDIKDHRIKWETQVAISKDACRMGGSKINLRCGEKLTILDLMKSAMIASSNDAAYMLGQFLGGGNVSEFISRMNRRAETLGMNSTFFSNPTGLPSGSKATDNHSSPSDLLILATELLKYPEITDIASRDAEPVQHGIRSTALRNHNRLVATYKDEVNGLKTGFTVNAGFCIVATANRKNHRLISIVLGVQKSWTRNTIVASMLNNYYSEIGLGKMGEDAVEDSDLVQNNEAERD